MRTQPTAVAMRSALKTLFTTLAAIISVSCFQVTAAQARSVTYNLDIPAQSLNDALQALALASQHKLLYSSELVDGKRAPAIKGEFTTEQAVGQLLTGTGLIYEISDGLVLIRSKDTPLPVSKQMEGVATSPSLFASGKNSPSPREGRRVRDEGLRVAQNEKDQATPDKKTDQPSETKDEQLSEIIVTAQKRAENLQDVPIAITVVSGETLDKSSSPGSTDVLRTLPGVDVNEPFQSGGTVIAIRGVGNPGGGAVFALPSTTAFYVDTIPFGFVQSAFLPDVNAYDLERVEVLRGPQGTLYGASALNGVVRMLTHDADLDRTEVKGRLAASTTSGGGEGFRADSALNIPLIPGKLAVRAVAGYQKLGGWIDHPNQSDANDGERLNFRLKVNAQPTDNLSLGLFAWLSRSDDGDISTGGDDGTNPATLPQPIVNDFNAFGMNIGYDFSNFSATSSTSYIDYKLRSRLDLGVLGIPGENLLNADFDAEVFAEEVNLTSTTDGPWRWTLGGIYRNASDTSNQMRQTPAGSPTLGYVQPQITKLTSESYAFFGELTRTFADGLFDLTGGLRYFRDNVGVDEKSVGASLTAPLLKRNTNFEAVTPRAVLTFHPSHDLNFYASYAQGFRSGSEQDPAVPRADPNFGAVDPDKLTNYEIGTKGSLLDERVFFEAAVYYIDWQDVQQSLAVQTIPNGPILIGFVNGQSASGLGFDVSVTVKPVEMLTLYGTYSVNDLEFDGDVVDVTGAVIYRKGDRLNNSQRYTLSGGADLEVPIGTQGFSALLSGNVSHRPATASLFYSAGNVLKFPNDAITLVSADLRLISPRGWSVGVFADNLANEKGSPITGGNIWDQRLRPRTIGLQFDFGF